MYLKEILRGLIERGVTTVPDDIKDALRIAYRKERNRIAKAQLSLILKNIEIAKRDEVPLCQDTGIPVFYVRIGRRCKYIFNVEEELSHALVECTKRSLLRPNIVDPITRKNSTDNSGKGIPIMHYEMSDGNNIEITFVPKGAGTENMGKLILLTPGEGYTEIEKKVLEHVSFMGGRPCPPYVFGIGIGGTSERCMQLAKKASIRSLKKRNVERSVALFEKRLLSVINKSGIGPMGLGGNTTCLGVNVEKSACHTATMPVAFTISCWASRRASVRLSRHGHTWTD